MVMNLFCCSFDDLKRRIEYEGCRIVLFGAGVIGQVTVPEILYKYGLIDNVEVYLDNNELMLGKTVLVHNRKINVCPPDYLEKCGDNIAIFINISRFTEVYRQLNSMECTRNMDCYIIPMLLVHNYCTFPSTGVAVLSEKPLIPKKIHYMWLGGKTIPENLQKCIDSWHKYCPDYEIIEWNENNYDLDKHPYMRQAYEAGAYGFLPDYARLDILYLEGGIYMDTDVELVRNIDDLLYQEAFCGVEKWQTLNFGGMSGAVKGHPMIKSILDARQDVTFLDSEGKWSQNTCGFYDTPVILKEGYRINGETQCINGMNVYAYDYFHPYDYMSGIVNKTENTHSIHWFNGGWLDEKMKSANEETKNRYSELYDSALHCHKDVIRG